VIQSQVSFALCNLLRYSHLPGLLAVFSKPSRPLTMVVVLYHDTAPGRRPGTSTGSPEASSKTTRGRVAMVPQSPANAVGGVGSIPHGFIRCCGHV